MDGTWLKENKTYDKELFEKEFQIMQDRDINVVAEGNQYESIFHGGFPDYVLYFIAGKWCFSCSWTSDS